jgi:hypothetical protein
VRVDGCLRQRLLLEDPGEEEVPQRSHLRASLRLIACTDSGEMSSQLV